MVFGSADRDHLTQTTLGDNVQSQPLYTFGGKGALMLTHFSVRRMRLIASCPSAALWTKELEVALLSNQVDAIVHSLKDVPTEFPPGCELGAVLEREDPSDALVVKEGLPYTSLEEMPEGSVIGTSSVRRVAQLRRKFPGLKFADVVRFAVVTSGQSRRRANVGFRHRAARQPRHPPPQARRPELDVHGAHPRLGGPHPSQHGLPHHLVRLVSDAVPCRRPRRDRRRGPRGRRARPCDHRQPRVLEDELEDEGGADDAPRA